MRKSARKKLALARETLVVLQVETVANVVGAVALPGMPEPGVITKGCDKRTLGPSCMLCPPRPHTTRGLSI